MSDSGYFNGSKFRAMDSNAFDDENPLSSVLEATISNNHKHLHKHGGGSVTRAMGASASGTQYATNYQSHVGVDWTTIMVQPFLMMRGLKRVIVDWYGTSEWEDEFLGVDVKLELRGFAYSQVETFIEADAPSNFHKQIILELSGPFDSEFETELVLWAKSQADQDFDASEYIYSWVSANDGLIYYLSIPASGTVSDNHFRCVFSYTPPIKPSGEAEYNGVQASTLLEPLYRNQTAPNPDGSGTTATFLINYPVNLSRTWSGEYKVGGLTSRSIIVSMEYE